MAVVAKMNDSVLYHNCFTLSYYGNILVVVVLVVEVVVVLVVEVVVEVVVVVVLVVDVVEVATHISNKHRSFNAWIEKRCVLVTYKKWM